MIRDKYMQNRNILGYQCQSCKRYSHKTTLCPLVQFIPNHSQVIGKYNFSNFQNRVQVGRNLKQKYRVLSDLILIKESLKEIKADFVVQCAPELEDICSQAISNYSDIEFYLNLPSIQFSQSKPLIIEDDPIQMQQIHEMLKIEFINNKWQTDMLSNQYEFGRPAHGRQKQVQLSVLDKDRLSQIPIRNSQRLKTTFTSAFAANLNH